MKIDDMRKLTNLKLTPTKENQSLIQEYLRTMGIDPSLLYQELEMSSRYVNTHQDASYSNATVSLHSHNYYELLHCRTTVGVEYVVGPHLYRLQRGDVVYVPPGVSHRPLLPEDMDEPYVRDVLWISREWMENLSRMIPDTTATPWEHSGLLRTAGTRWEFLGELFQSGVREETEKKPGWETAVMGNSLMILTHLLRASLEHSFGNTEVETPELRDRITAYIEEHYAAPLGIGELARQFFVSESTISHLFKQKMGVSLYRYISQRRLIASKVLIQEGQPLETISRQVGFADYSTFFRAFRQEYGISPRQYRQLQDSGNS